MKLSQIILESKPDFEVKGINLGYTDYGHFYGAYLYPVAQTANLPFGTKREKLHYQEAEKYIKDLTGMDLPDTYKTGQLDAIVAALKKKGIYADHDDVMDVS
jgi:hypothetical protein